LAQDLREFGRAELTGSTGSVRQLRQPKPRPLVPRFTGCIHGAQCRPRRPRATPSRDRGSMAHIEQLAVWLKGA
jgi:hypothetical protein